MEQWDSAGVRTEKVIFEGRAFDAPLVLTKGGDILPLVFRRPRTPLSETERESLRKRHPAAEALIQNMDLVLRLRRAIYRMKVRDWKSAILIVDHALELLSDATQLYRLSKRDDEVHRLCVMVTRQIRMGLLALQLQEAVFRALEAGNPNIVYRKFARAPEGRRTQGLPKGKSGREYLVTELSKENEGKSDRGPSSGHVYEIVQATAKVTVPVLQTDWEAGIPIPAEESAAMKLLPTEQTSDALEDLCQGISPEGEACDSDFVYGGAGLYYGDEPHVCCALPSVAPPPSVVCETELHNRFVTRWEPWGAEEKSALVAMAVLLRDSDLMCERLLCFGLDRKDYAEV
jgi:hypothetical protein